MLPTEKHEPPQGQPLNFKIIGNTVTQVIIELISHIFNKCQTLEFIAINFYTNNVNDTNHSVSMVCAENSACVAPSSDYNMLTKNSPLFTRKHGKGLS